MTLRERLPERVTVVEVGPRDGLQNEKAAVAARDKIEFVNRLSDAGLPVVEVTSFVNPKRVPQLADADEVMAEIRRRRGVDYPVLVPNEAGLDRALAAGVKHIAVFASATESFSKSNLGRTRDEAIAMFRPVCARAAEAGVSIRGYISMVLDDPTEGPVDAREVVETGLRLLSIGCSQLSLGDTIGTGTPGRVQDLLATFDEAGVGPRHLAVHFHDTYGQALANVVAALEAGVTVVDSSAGGLGGCPFAQSATGNLATEDLVYMLDGLGVETGVDVAAVAAASRWMCERLGIEVPGRVARALR